MTQGRHTLKTPAELSEGRVHVEAVLGGRKNVLKGPHEKVCFPEAPLSCGQQDRITGVKVTGIILTTVLPGFASLQQSQLGDTGQTLIPVSASAPGAEPHQCLPWTLSLTFAVYRLSLIAQDWSYIV